MTKARTLANFDATFDPSGVLTSASTLDATKLLGDLPALNGSALTNLPSSSTDLAASDLTTAVAGANYTLTYNKVWKKDGIVYVNIHATNSGTPDNNAVVATLPSGYRPNSTPRYVGGSVGYQGDLTDVVYVNTDGTIKIGSPVNVSDSGFRVRLGFFFHLTE